MDLLQNPFHILNASPRDNRQRIMELADERSLLLDSSVCMEARSALTNPRKRLSAEVAWLPGLSPSKVAIILAWLEKPVSSMLTEKILFLMSPIAQANLLAACLSRLLKYNSKTVSDYAIKLASCFEKVELESLCKTISEERLVAGFPDVTDISALESELQERRRYYREVVKLSLDRLSSSDLVASVTFIVDSATKNGELHAPILVDDLVDSYEVEAQGFLDNEEQNIRTLVDRLRLAVEKGQPDSVLAPMIDQLIKVVKNWDAVAQPIQVSGMSRGLDHDASHQLAWFLRELAIELFNDHDKLEFSTKITKMLQEVFAEVLVVAEKATEDAEALIEIADHRKQLIEEARKQEESWKREITYEADIGTIFKDKLHISPKGIGWKGNHWNLEQITAVRWGGTRHSVNGVPTGTTYTIIFGNPVKHAKVEISKESIYSNFTERLWKTVCVRLLTEFLESMKKGEKYCFANAKVSDFGIDLERKKLLGANETVFCKWSDLSIWNANGCFCIGRKDDKKVSVALSYLDLDNVHILEAAMRILWKNYSPRISSILEG